MAPFWILFLIPALATLMPGRLPTRQAAWVWFAVGVLFSVLMGFRHEVGADWFNYLPQFQEAASLTIAEVVAKPDPGYYLLNWLVAYSGADIYWVNFLCASVLMWGTLVFCRRQPNPWLALVAAVPYMLIVVGMGYTRQSAALGFVLVGLAALGAGRARTFVVWVVIGALFHKSAVLLLPIAALAGSRNRLLTGILVLAVTVLMYYLLVEESVEALWTNYVDADMQSQGAAIRVAMNAVPAVILFLARRRLAPQLQERKLWLWIAFFSLACIPLLGLASTAVDRVALYLLPLQLFVFSRLPRLAGTTRTRTPLVLAIVGCYAAVQFVWLNYAAHAQYWVPYQFVPFGR